MSKIGVSDFKFAVMTDGSDVKGGTATYGDWNNVPGLVSIDIKTNGNVVTNFADNGPFETAANLGEISVAIEHADITDEVRAKLLGHAMGATGEMEYSADDVAPYVALCFTGKNADGSKKHVKLLKVKFSEFGDNYQTEKASVEFRNDSIEGQAAVRICDKLWKKTLDERNTGVTPADITAFLAAV